MSLGAAVEHAATGFLLSYGYLALFVLMTLETAMILHFVPSEVIVPVATAALAHDAPGLVLVILVSTLGATAGSLLLYAFARFGGRGFLERHAHRIGLTPARRERLDAQFQRPRGESLVFFFRLLPIVRAIISIPAGLAKMDWRKFVLLSAAGSLLFDAALAYPTYAAQRDPNVIAQMRDAHDYLATRWPILLAGFLILATLGILAYRRREHYAARPHLVVRHFWLPAALALLAAGLVTPVLGLLWPGPTFAVITYVFVDGADLVNATGIPELAFLLGLAASLVTIGLAALTVTPFLERRFGRFPSRSPANRK